MAAENVLVVHAAQLKVLTHAGAAHQADSLGSGLNSAVLHLLRAQLFLKVHENGVLVAGDHDIHIVRVNDV